MVDGLRAIHLAEVGTKTRPVGFLLPPQEEALLAALRAAYDLP